MNDKPIANAVSPANGKKMRRFRLVNPHFQYRLIGLLLGNAIFILLIFYIANMFFFWQFMSLGHVSDIPETHPFFGFIAEQRHEMGVIFAFTAAAVTVIVLTVGFVLSHRVAGALFRFQNHMDTIARTGELKELGAFRKEDYFGDLATGFNRMIVALKEQKNTDRK